MKIKYSLVALLCIVFVQAGFSQAEIEAWGNMRGIRVDGELMKMESSIMVVGAAGSPVNATGKERQRPRYRRNENTQTVSTRIDSFYVVQQVEDMDKGLVRVKINVTAKKDTVLEGVFFQLSIPFAAYSKGTIQVFAVKKSRGSIHPVAQLDKDINVDANAVQLMSAGRQVKISFDGQAHCIVRKTSDRNGSFINMLVQLNKAAIKKDAADSVQFTIKASGSIDNLPASLVLDTGSKGALFDGFGGNFRLQNRRNDPQVIDYCLANMRVAWGRVEMPWQLWQPVKNSNPVEEAKAGKLNDQVKQSMEMAARLYKKGMPVILTAWFPPQWAVEGKLHNGPGADGVWGNPLDTASMQQIYASIASYIVYLKDVYQTDIALFSFNESDLGINIRQTGEQHAALIKGLGAYFASHAIKTKMLLGDNSDATTYAFVYPAMKDTTTHPYIGAVSFHSWRGCDTATLLKWKAVASEMKLPLIVGEGSIDAAAWNYPLIFEEQTYAMDEIDLYVRMLAVCQPLSILQWQLTADYSPLSGGGIFGNNEPLRPTRRFWNLKQLASVPGHIRAIPVTVDRPNITCAAQGSTDNGQYAIHLVNNGTGRKIHITGLPASLKQLKVLITSQRKNMQEQRPVQVRNGSATLQLDQMSYTTLVTE